MDSDEALAILDRKLREYRAVSYRELVEMIGIPRVLSVRGSSGTSYQLEIQAFWDAKPGGDVRVLGSIDDGGMHAIVPPTLDFVKAPDGKFVGEAS